MTLVAKLDKRQRFVGLEDVEDSEGRVVVSPGIDLPVDGSYAWNGSAFEPVEQAAALLPTEPSVDPDYAMFLFMRSVVNGTPVPDEVRQYTEWYEANMLVRAERFTRRRKRILRVMPRR